MRRLLTALALLAPATLFAAPLTGSFTISGSVLPLAAGAPNVYLSTFIGATALDFNDFASPLTPTPGTDGRLFVNSATGDFATFLPPLTLGTIKDISYVGPGTASFPKATPTILSFELISGLTVDLLSIAIDGAQPPTATRLDLLGTVAFHRAGFSDTTGALSISSTTTNGVLFGFTADHSARGAPPPPPPVPEPASLVLFGMALAGLGWRRRRWGAAPRS